MDNDLALLEQEINAILKTYGVDRYYRCYDVKMSKNFLESISGDKVKTIWADKLGNIRISYHSWYKPPIDDSTVEQE